MAFYCFTPHPVLSYSIFKTSLKILLVSESPSYYYYYYYYYNFSIDQRKTLHKIANYPVSGLDFCQVYYPGILHVTIGKLTEIFGALSKINPYINLVGKLTHLFGLEFWWAFG